MSEDLNSLVRKFRIFSGTILFLFVFTHLLNHSVNIISISAADYIKDNYFHLLWKNPIGTVLLYGSFLVHIPLGFYDVGKRRTFKMSGKEWIQIIFPILGFFFLLFHIASAFIATRIFNAKISYEFVFSDMIFSEPSGAIIFIGILFAIVVTFIWVHGVIGINTLLRYNMRSYKRYVKYLYIIYIGVPVLGISGFWSGLKEQSLIAYVKSLQGDENFLMSIISESVPQGFDSLYDPVDSLIENYYPLIVLGLILIAIVNVVRAKYFGRIKVGYPGSEVVTISKGTSILEASKIANIPHQSMCGGKGRCSTCRVKVVSAQGSLPAPNAYEKRSIDRIGLEEDIRLACQLRPTSDLSVIPLVNPQNSLERATNPVSLSGKEKETAILFIDLRNFTKLSEQKLPYDVVYILNKYYSVCGKIIESNVGRIDKFIGDGIMAIFDSSGGIGENCRNAVKAASEISENMNSLNGQMKIEFSEDIRFGMGIHAGDTIVGLMGYGKIFTETAVGDNVNVASRLEELTKTYTCELVISRYVADKAKLNLDKFNSNLVKIRGREESMEILSISNAAEINL